MFGFIRPVVIVPDVWCYEVSGYPVRCLVLSHSLTCQIPGVMSVITMPDVLCYEVSGYSDRSLVLGVQWLSCLMSGVMLEDTFARCVWSQWPSCKMFGIMGSVAILPDFWWYVSGYLAGCLVLWSQWLSCQMPGVMSVAALQDFWCYEFNGYNA